MTSRRWLISLLAIVLSGIALCAAAAYFIDPYGLLRNSSGRALSIFFAERKAKFLMSKRYVPSNFQGLLIGPSSSANWDLSVVAGARMFNESIDGANAHEEKILVDQALPRGNYRLAVVILHPIMTASHDVKEGLDTASSTEAVGSIHLFVHETCLALKAAHLGFIKSSASTNGQLVFDTPRRLQPEAIKPAYLRLDPVALGQFRQMIESLQTQGVRVVYVIPPFYQPCYAVNERDMRNYLATIQPLIPSAPLIDFNSAEFDAFRNDPDNFIDCFHLEPRGAETIAGVLRQRIPALVGAADPPVVAQSTPKP